MTLPLDVRFKTRRWIVHLWLHSWWNWGRDWSPEIGTLFADCGFISMEAVRRLW
jgi:hypothetical protein